MTSKMELALKELAKLSDEEQDLAAEAILDYASGDPGLRLTDEQIAEVRRRLADRDAPTMTLDEFETRLQKLGA